MVDWSGTSPAKLLAAHVGKQRNTSRSYRGDMACFADWLRVQDSQRATERLVSMERGEARRTLDEYVTWLRSRYALNTVRRRVQCLLGLLRVANDYDVIPWAIRKFALPAPEPVRNVRGPERSEVEAMLEACRRRGDPKGLRDEALFRLLAFSALRAEEALSLDLCHVDVDAREIELLSKGLWGTARTRFVIGLDTARAIASWIEVRGDDDGPLFRTLGRGVDAAGRLTYRGLYHVVHRAGQALDVDCHPHALRHFAATECLRLSNGNVVLAMALTRHRDPRTLMVYNDERLTRAREAMEILASGIPVYRHGRPGVDNL
jgi:integrase/recombinase XerC